MAKIFIARHRRHGPQAVLRIAKGEVLGGLSQTDPTTRICLGFWLPCVMLPLGHIYVIVAVPLIPSPEASFPGLP